MAVSQCEGYSLARTLPCEWRSVEMRLECCLAFVAFEFEFKRLASVEALPLFNTRPTPVVNIFIF